jgi:D-cysteine desulfhydrase
MEIVNPNYPDRIHIAHLPTTIERLDRLSKHLAGPELLIKRDDQTGVALGGNKVRKLEFLVADAKAQGCDHLITSGAPQSNHCRQTAAAAARSGLSCSLVLRGSEPLELTGNLLLNNLLGAHMHWADETPLSEIVKEVADEVSSMGRHPYVVPLGGSNVMGATGFVLAMHEIMRQLAQDNIHVDFIVFASSSGGTQAGMVLGAKVYGFHGRILGISIDRPAEELKTQVAALATATATHLGLETLSVVSDVEVNDDYIGPGYSILTEVERDAIRMVAELEGILLDPVYTGRAMGGLIDLIRWGAFTRSQRVLFWHTGGTPALFAYGKELQ